MKIQTVSSTHSNNSLAGRSPTLSRCSLAPQWRELASIGRRAVCCVAHSVSALKRKIYIISLLTQTIAARNLVRVLLLPIHSFSALSAQTADLPYGGPVPLQHRNAHRCRGRGLGSVAGRGDG